MFDQVKVKIEALRVYVESNSVKVTTGLVIAVAVLAVLVVVK